MTIAPMKVDLTVGPTGNSGRLLLDGVDVSSHVTAVRIDATVGAVTAVTVDFILVDVTVDATAVVEGVAVPVLPITVRWGERTVRATEWHRDGSTIVIDECEDVA